MKFRNYYFLIITIFSILGSIANYLLTTYANPVLAVSQADPNGSLMTAEATRIPWVLLGTCLGILIVVIHSFKHRGGNK